MPEDPRSTNLPARIDRDELRQVATGAAWRAGLPLAVALATIPLWLQPFFYWGFAALRELGFGHLPRLFLVNGAVYVGALAGLVLLSRLLDGTVRRAARRSEPHGRAAIAGICLTAAGLGLVAMPIAAWWSGRLLLTETAFRLLAVALGVGVLGSRGYAVLAEETGRPGALPGLYPLARAAGVASVGALAAGGLAGLAASFLGGVAAGTACVGGAVLGALPPMVGWWRGRGRAAALPPGSEGDPGERSTSLAVGHQDRP